MDQGAVEAPSVDTLWSAVVSVVPEPWHPFLGMAVLGYIGFSVASQGLQRGLDLASTVRRFARERREIEDANRTPPTPEPEPNQPRQSIWNTPVSDVPRPRPDGIPIVTTANMKGGVGKTTLTANLAAYLDAQGKRVLLIDFDYQGSLSQTALAAAGNSRLASLADDLIRGERSAAAILDGSQSLTPAMENSRILTCYYEFSDTELTELAKWITAAKPTGNRDLRFRLCNILRDPVVQEQFDIVLIDAPPRFSTGTINALCASTHLLIPTVLDHMSAEAVIYFSRDVALMRDTLFPSLRLAGVVPSLVWRQDELSPREDDTIRNLNRSLAASWGRKDTVLAEAAIPRKNIIGDIAGLGIAYVDAGTRPNTRKVRELFDPIAAKIVGRINA